MNLIKNSIYEIIFHTKTNYRRDEILFLQIIKLQRRFICTLNVQNIFNLDFDFSLNVHFKFIITIACINSQITIFTVQFYSHKSLPSASAIQSTRSDSTFSIHHYFVPPKGTNHAKCNK